MSNGVRWSEARHKIFVDLLRQEVPADTRKRLWHEATERAAEDEMQFDSIKDFALEPGWIAPRCDLCGMYHPTPQRQPAVLCASCEAKYPEYRRTEPPPPAHPFAPG